MLRVQAATNTKDQLANSPDLNKDLLNASIGALDEHNSMNTQALNSPALQDGDKGHSA
jgi:type I restriction enzyme, R subunit